MPDFMTWSALPNLHPLSVHFPIALLPVAILFDLVGLLVRHEKWLERAAAALYGAAALGALLAEWAGEKAADSLVGVATATLPHIAKHSDWAHYAVWAMGVLAVLRLSVMLWDSDSVRLALQALLILFGLATLALLIYAADLGGALVYRHALGVDLSTAEKPPAPTRPSRPAADNGPAISRLVRFDSGTLRWDPLPEDRGALGKVLAPAPGFSIATISATRVEPGASGTGLGVKVDGTTLLLLPGPFSDVRVEAVLDLIDFAGIVGVAHHVSDPSSRGLVTLSADGRTTLIDRKLGLDNLLDAASTHVSAGTFTLAVSSSDRHLKGLLDGKTVTQGRAEPGAAGGCGLYLAGKGSLRIVSLSVTPLAGG